MESISETMEDTPAFWATVAVVRRPRASSVEGSWKRMVTNRTALWTCVIVVWWTIGSKGVDS